MQSSLCCSSLSHGSANLTAAGVLNHICVRGREGCSEKKLDREYFYSRWASCANREAAAPWASLYSHIHHRFQTNSRCWKLLYVDINFLTTGSSSCCSKKINEEFYRMHLSLHILSYHVCLREGCMFRALNDFFPKSKIKVLSSFTHPRVSPNMFDFLSSA